MAFIDAHRTRKSGGLRWGVEPICRTLQIAPSTYYDAKGRPPSARALRDAELGPKLKVLWQRNYSVYGRRKLTVAARKAGINIGRDQVARLMRAQDIRGASRSKKRFTTRCDPAQVRAPDLVNRDFTATRPNHKWVADFTYCSTWSGIVYVAFIIDVFSRRIVGWKASRTMTIPLALDALNMAAWTRRGVALDGLICHSDAGAQAGLNWSLQHLDDGGVGDGDDEGAAAGGAAVSGADPVARAADGGMAAGPGPVLGGDCSRREDRRRGGRGWGVIPRWVPVVPPRWRCESLSVPGGVGPVSVVLGA